MQTLPNAYAVFWGMPVILFQVFNTFYFIYLTYLTKLSIIRDNTIITLKLITIRITHYAHVLRVFPKQMHIHNCYSTVLFEPKCVTAIAK